MNNDVELTVDQLNKLKLEDKLCIVKLPFEVPKEFLEIWDKESEVKRRESKGLFTNIEREKDGSITLSCVGYLASSGVLLFGIAYGVYTQTNRY